MQIAKCMLDYVKDERNALMKIITIVDRTKYI